MTSAWNRTLYPADLPENRRWPIMRSNFRMADLTGHCVVPAKRDLCRQPPITADRVRTAVASIRLPPAASHLPVTDRLSRLPFHPCTEPHEIILIVVALGNSAPIAMGGIFISYAKEDRTYAEKLCRALKLAGFDAWLDIEKLLPGQKWRTEIVQAI